MIMGVRQLEKLILRAKDGEIGQTINVFFDDTSWAIRYLVVRAGSWLDGREILLSPAVLDQPDWQEKLLPVRLTCEQVAKSPGAETTLPVSRQHEIELARHYGWPIYWYWPVEAGVQPVNVFTPALFQEPLEGGPPHADPHLQSVHDVRGYHLHATDGRIGHVQDFLFDDASWLIRYIEVDTRNWLPGGKRVIMAPRWAGKIDWDAQEVTVQLDRERIRLAPPYDEHVPVNRQYEKILHEHYGRGGYWDEKAA